jgi:hypothetical protein
VIGDIVLTLDGDGHLVPGVVQELDKLTDVATVLAFAGGGCLRLEGLSLVASAGNLVPGTYCPQAGA